MKVALFTDTYTPDINGVAKTLNRWVNYLQSQGHAVRVFAPEVRDKNISSEETINRYKSFPFFLYPELQAALPNPIHLERSILNFRPDIIHVATPFNLGLFGRHFSRKHSIPLVASYHTNLDQYLTSYKLEWAENLLKKYLFWFHQECKKVYVPSKGTAQSLMDQHYSHVELWKRGVDSTLFKPIENYKKTRQEILARYNLSADKFTVLYVGRLATEKSLDILMRTIEKIPRAIRNKTQFILVGDGPMHEEIEKYIKNSNVSIHLLGFREDQELAEIYAAADVFFFPSTTETFGNVVLEALASGLPVIAANSGGVKELVSSGENGILCSPGNFIEFSNALEMLYTHEYTRLAFSEKARSYAVTQSWHHIFEALLESYQNVSSKHSSS